MIEHEALYLNPDDWERWIEATLSQANTFVIPEPGAAVDQVRLVVVQSHIHIEELAVIFSESIQHGGYFMVPRIPQGAWQ